MTTPRLPGEFGQGALGRLTTGLYWILVVTVLLLVACLPTIVLWLLLDNSLGNLPYVVLAAIPLGPALSAALYATRDRVRAEGLTPAVSFWRGYRQNWADVLKLWAPALLVLAVIGFVIVNRGAAGISDLYAVILGAIALVVLVWALHAVAIASFFGFRTRDLARLAVFYLVSLPVVSLGVVALLVVAGAVLWFATGFGLAVLGGVWVWFWYRNDLRLVDSVTERFVAAAPGEVPDE